MRLRRRFVLSVAATLSLLSSSALADEAFIFIPGVAGSSTAEGRAGWTEVVQHTLTLAPGFLAGDKKTVVNPCTATVEARFGSGAATVARLVGAPAGEVLLEVERGVEGGQTYYRATLRNAVIVQEVAAFAAGALAADRLTLRFDEVHVAVARQNADGTVGPPTEGTFTCTAAP
jgi:type VI protein secretion system component Hcp